MNGQLILLNMPIGSDADYTGRVLGALKTGIYFLVEDTRTFKDQLKSLGIELEGKTIYSLHDHSSEADIHRYIDLLQTGNTVYVASEAGSPVLSDPAYKLLKHLQDKNISIKSYSGISAVNMALELSCLPPVPFTFHAFLPREEGKIKKYFEELKAGTHLFFEAPNRVLDTLGILAQIFPDAPVSVSKEMTKTFENTYRFVAKDFKEVSKEIMFKGEFVICFYLNQSNVTSSLEATKMAQELLDTGLNTKSVSRLLAEILNLNAKEVYQILESKKRN